MDLIYQATWLKPDYDCGEAACEFYRNFSAEKEVARATLWVSALGVYVARINGTRVSYVLAPGWTVYHKRVQYQTYDITTLLRGDNTLSITVAQGWRMKFSATGFRGISQWDAEELSSTEYAVIAALQIEYADGSKTCIFTDDQWQMHETKWRSCHIYNGDVFDATFEATENKPFRMISHSKDILVPQEGETIGEQERLSPVAVIHTPSGETVLDFGQNLTGYLEILVDLPYGVRGVIHHAEVLDSAGNFYRNNYRSAKAEIVLVGCGKKFLWKPEFTFYGFRYVRLTEWVGEVDPGAFVAVVVHSDMERTGFFECSDEKINQLYHNIIWGQKSNFLDVPTDCPQRDERLGWTGDAQVFARCACYNYQTDRFFRKWLSDMTLDQLEDGRIPPVIPNLAWGRAACGWSDVCVIVPWQMYLLYGDRDILQRQFVTMKRWIDYMRDAGETYIRGDRHYGDWLAQDGDPNKCVGSTSTAYLAYAFCAYSTTLFLKICRILGISRDESNPYETFLSETKARIHAEFFNNGKMQIETQTALVIALAFDLCPIGTENQHAEKLASMIHMNGDRLTTGFLGTPYLLHVLTRYGYADVAYRLLFQNKMPSWLFSVEHGATTMWEHWDGIREDGSLWSDDMNSFNHYAYGAVGDWLYGTVAGIETDEEHPGFSHIRFCPIPTEKLEYVRASMKTRYGEIRSSWRHMDGMTEYCFTVPAGTTATAVLGGNTYKLVAGDHRFLL